MPDSDLDSKIALQTIQFENLRNLKPHTLSFGALNYVYGSNGSGKTSLLEGAYILGALKSFRSAKSLDRLIQYQKPYLHLTYQVKGMPFALQKGKGSSLQLRVEEKTSSQVEFLKMAPATWTFSPHLPSLISDEAGFRRQLFDWMMFHVEPSFYDAWRFYDHALKNRNAGLRQGFLSDDNFWCSQLSQFGHELNRMRLYVFEKWRKLWKSLATRGEAFIFELDVLFDRGFLGEDLSSFWKKEQENDQRLGYTRGGPHRFDYPLLLQDGSKASYVLSRGQQKRVELLWLLAAVSLVQKEKNVLLLLDDMNSELDQSGLVWVLDVIKELSVQVLSCGITPMNALLQNKGDWSIFCVSNGEIKKK